MSEIWGGVLESMEFSTELNIMLSCETQSFKKCTIISIKTDKFWFLYSLEPENQLQNTMPLQDSSPRLQSINYTMPFTHSNVLTVKTESTRVIQ